MVKSAFGDTSSEKYIKKLAKEENFSIGLILGQSYSGKYYIVHFAKTPPIQDEDNTTDHKADELPKSLSEVNESWITEHARHTTRMLPGGMCVLGIFIVSENDIFNPFNAKLKSILSVVHKQLSMSKYLYGSNEFEKLILHFSKTTNRFTAKTVDVATSNVQPTEIKFSPEGTKWSILECRYMIDQVYYLSNNENEGQLKKHTKAILDKIYTSLSSNVFIFDNEIKDKDDYLENIKKSKGQQSSATKAEHHPINVVMLEAISGENSSFEPVETGGYIKLVGDVACKLYLCPKVIVADASQAVIQDIMRSLSTRLEMHWDSLTEEELSEDLNSVHEPPRKVLVTLDNVSNVTFSDYLFPGEGVKDTEAAFEEMFDVHDVMNVCDVERQADIAEYYTEDPYKNEKVSLIISPSEPGRFMFRAALIVGLVVLFMAVLIHFL